MFSPSSFAHDYPSLACWTLSMLTFHTACLFFEILDRNCFLNSFKIYHATDNTPSYYQMLPRVLFNQIFLLLPSMILITQIKLSYAPKPHQPGPLQSIIAIILVTPALHEISFYIVHRYLLHSSWGFHRLNHALHHTTKVHSAVSAMYMSAPDFLLEIVLPYVVPLVFVSNFNLVSNVFCTTIFPLGAFGGLYEHSGYNFLPNIPALDTTVHGLHHIYYDCSFADGVGSPSILDSFFLTVCAHVGPMAPIFSTKTQRIVKDTNARESCFPSDIRRLRSFRNRLSRLWKPLP